MQIAPQENEIYKHFKGNLYQIITLAKHSETGEDMVVYRGLYAPFETYVRPRAMFFERVDKEKYPDAVQKYRFEKQGELPPMESSHEIDAKSESKVSIQEESNPVENVEYEIEEVQLDPAILKFLDADTYEEKLDVFVRLHNRVTVDMLRTIAAALDVELRDGELEEQYQELKNCLLTFEKFECNRLR